MSTVYVGAFPPDYGGVTIKNQNLFIALEKEIEIKKIDLNKVKRGGIKEVVRFVFYFLNPMNQFVIGISGKTTRKRFTQILYYLNRRAMRKSIIMIMGGTASHDMSIDPEYRKCAMGYKRIYVETQSMKTEMNAAGFENVEVYPNGRFKPQQVVQPKGTDKRLQCVFFSLIQPEKGADLVLEAAKALSDVNFAFYGRIVPQYEKSFMLSVNSLENVSYCGIFKGTNEEVYAELSKYDILLLPTKWNSEGVPGVLVEGKIAGLAEIVSNKSYNAEIVRNGIEGFVLEENSGEELCAAIKGLQRDRDLLAQIKAGSKKSAERFYIENYIGAIKKVLEERV